MKSILPESISGAIYVKATSRAAELDDDRLPVWAGRRGLVGGRLGGWGCGVEASLPRGYASRPVRSALELQSLKLNGLLVAEGLGRLGCSHVVLGGKDFLGYPVTKGCANVWLDRQGGQESVDSQGS